MADSSLAEDRKALARYAWAKIPAIWIVDLNNDTVEVHTRPSGNTPLPCYEQTVVVGRGDQLSFLLPGRAADDPAGVVCPIAVESLLS